MTHGVQTSETVQSNDGTAIAFDRKGHGPSVIFVGGALNSTLVLVSEGTSAYLADSARRATDSIPGAVSRTLPGEFHEVDPQTLAAELTAFLAA